MATNQPHEGLVVVDVLTLLRISDDLLYLYVIVWEASWSKRFVPS
jgi:hypothetical protein